MMTKEELIHHIRYSIDINADIILTNDEGKKVIKALEQEPKTGHCEDCKHFRKFPYHTDTLGRCFQHTGFCPRGDWYCADFEPQESEE